MIAKDSQPIKRTNAPDPAKAKPAKDTHEPYEAPHRDGMHVNAGFNDGSASFEAGWSGKRDAAFKDMPGAL